MLLVRLPPLFSSSRKIFQLTECALILALLGWTVFENLYQLNETFYVVAANATTLPPVSGMISTGADIWNTKESIASR